MKPGRIAETLALMMVATTMGMTGPVRADETAPPKAAAPLGAFWALPKEDGKLTLVLAGQAEPVTVAVSNTTILSGTCLDCNLPLEFKPGESAKKCNVCGCAVSNASCIVGKPMKDGTWQAMIKGLPHGVALRPTYNMPDKPESGLKRLAVDLRSVLLPVTGLETQTPAQLLLLVKPLGGSQAEMIDGGKRLSIHLKSDWTFAREAKLEKALTTMNAKLVVAEDAKPAQ